MISKSNIVLIGFMGCGKTTVGKVLAELLKYKFADTDGEIETQADMSIPQIFEAYGEDHFRWLEREAVANVALRRGYVIATGGGAVKNPENVSALKQNGVIVYLKADPHKLYQNTSKNNNRPLLKGTNRLQKIEELLEEREPLYESCADIIIDVSDLGVLQSAEQIISQIGMANSNYGQTNMHLN